MIAVHVGPDGTFKASGQHSSTSAEVDALFASLKSQNAKQIVLHFHGGLNTEAQGMAVATKMALVYQAANAHPLSFVWETGALDALKESVMQIEAKDLFQKALRWLMKRLASRAGIQDGKGAGTSVSMAEVEAELLKDVPFAEYDDVEVTGAARGGAPLSETDLTGLESELEEEFEDDLNGEEFEELSTPDATAKGEIGLKTAYFLAKLAYRVIKRRVKKRDHGLYPTVVEELINELDTINLRLRFWDPMKKKAEAMAKANDGLAGDRQHVGTYVLSKIAALQAERPEFRAHLVGHSAGCVVICQLLKRNAALAAPAKIETVIFLAAAARCDLGVAEVAKHPERFNRFRMFTMRDDYERGDHLLGRWYPRSLLYLISGVLEADESDAPLTGMNRHATLKKPFTQGPEAEWAKFINASKRLVLSDSSVINPGAPAGERCEAKEHGFFDDDDATRKSLIHMVSLTT